MRNKASALFLFTFLSAICVTSAIKAQENQFEVKILRGQSQKGFGCHFNNSVMPENEFEKIRAEEDCGELRALEVDFEKESLIAFHTQGDCHLHAAAKVFQDSEKKKYTVEVTNFYGGCRAAGNFYGLLVVKKIPADYSVEFAQRSADKAETRKVYEKWINNDVSYWVKKVDYESVDLKNCIQSKQFVIRNKTDFLSALRTDASRDWCLRNLPKIDFEENSLIGIELSTDYCSRPKGLQYEVGSDAKNKKYFFNITYDDPQGILCRRTGRYDISLLVPKISGEWEVKFDVKMIAPEKR